MHQASSIKQQLGASVEGKRPKAYSYLRFSTPEQMKGDSFRRQSAMAEAWATAHGLELDGSSYQDLGISAFRGANAETGRLGEFLAAVEDGVIERGSYLLIESLDRLSRNTPRKAVRLLESICDEGITLVTLADGKVYTKDVLDSDHTAFMWAFMVAIRANEESEMKARRLRAVWQSKRDRAAEKPMTSRCPAWLVLDKETGTFDVIEERAAVVRRIFDMLLQGVGKENIAETLNREGVPRFGRGMHWHRSYIQKLSENSAVVGTMIPHEHLHVDGKSTRRALEPVEGYYPAIIDPETFQRVQSLRIGTSSAVNRTPGAVNLLAGLARCPECGGSMTRVTKGSRKKAGQPYYVCSKAKVGAGCTYRAVKQDLVEQALLRDAPRWTMDVPPSDTDLAADLSAVSGELEAVETAIANVVGVLAVSPSVALTQKLQALEYEKEALERRRRELWERDQAGAGPLLSRRLEELLRVFQESPLDRLKASALMRQVLSGVVIDYTTGELGLEWKSGARSEVVFAWVE